MIEIETATITWVSYYNYGTFLQAYGLQKYLQTQNVSNKIINDTPIISPTEKENKKITLKKITHKLIRIYNRLLPQYRVYYKTQEIMCRNFSQFKKNELIIDYNIESVLNDISKYELYICGSDQIWSPLCIRPFYYANFTHKRKIAYAPSIGLTNIPKGKSNKIKSLLNSFEAISVREKSGVHALQELSDLPVIHVVDPTLLHSQQEWEKYIEETPFLESNDYVLGYFLTHNDIYIKRAKEYAKKKKLKFYMIHVNISDYFYADKLISGGPFDFIQYIKNAKYFFTDSYHGMIFSIIFETPFFILKRFKNEDSKNQNSRIESLLKLINASFIYIDETNINIIDRFSFVDFCEIKRLLSPHIENSKKYLKQYTTANYYL